MQPTVNIFLQILTEIGYTGDKQAFVDEFISICKDQALASLVEKLPKEKREALQQALLETNGVEKIGELLQSYIIAEDYSKALTEAIAAAMKDYFAAVLPALSSEQQQKIQTYVASLGSPHDVLASLTE